MSHFITHPWERQFSLIASGDLTQNLSARRRSAGWELRLEIGTDRVEPDQCRYFFGGKIKDACKDAYAWWYRETCENEAGAIVQHYKANGFGRWHEQQVSVIPSLKTQFVELRQIGTGFEVSLECGEQSKRPQLCRHFEGFTREEAWQSAFSWWSTYLQSDDRHEETVQQMMNDEPENQDTEPEWNYPQ